MIFYAVVILTIAPGEKDGSAISPTAFGALVRSRASTGYLPCLLHNCVHRARCVSARPPPMPLSVEDTLAKKALTLLGRGVYLRAQGHTISCDGLCDAASGLGISLTLLHRAGHDRKLWR